MGSETAPDFVFDQGLYYPSAANYFGYYSTGIESPGVWDESDHQRFFGLDGQDLQGLQTESLPYLYLTPSYGYAQSPYNPYNPYIPGAVIGTDGQFIGSQQYFTNPLYEQPGSSPAYIPAIVQSSLGSVANSSPDIGAPFSSRRPDGAATKYTPLLAFSNTAATSQNVASGSPISEPSMSSSHQIQTSIKLSNGSLVNVPQSKQSLSLSHGAMTAGSVPYVSQATDHLRNGRVSSVHSPLRVTMPANNGFTNFGSTVPEWTTVDKFRPRFQCSRAITNAKGSPNILGDQNRGPRTSRSKDNTTSAIAVQAYATKVGNNNTPGNTVFCADQYNRDDFPVDYPVAKFFVIKSYTEDDVHKSIKYNVWSSTPYGNKKLDNAYEDAQRISVGKPRKCPVFLFFSVNTSGQFCGIAEMIGHVDFHKNMDFWQQDKWIGSFPVKWYIIKDVPNTSLRHILLENNEFIPVTSSRDTQEITYIPGMGMLKIFKHSPLNSSLLDDFMYYEERERIMRERKSRLLGGSHGASLFLPVFVPSNGLGGTVDQPLEAYEKQLNGTVEGPPKADAKQSNYAFDQSRKSDRIEPSGKVEVPPKDGRKRDDAVNQYLEAEGNLLLGDVDQHPRADLIQQNGTFHQLSEANGIELRGTVDQPSEADGEQPNGTLDQPSKANASKLNHAVDQPSKANGKQSNGTVNLPPRADGKQPKVTVDQQPKADGKQSIDVVNQPLKAKETNGIVGHSLKPDQNSTSSNVLKISSNKQVIPMQVAIDPSDAKNDVMPDPIDVNVVNSVMKIDSLSIDSKVGEVNCSSIPADVVVTIGSMPVKIDKQSESFRGVFTVGSIPVDDKGRQLKQQGVFSDK